MSASSSIEPGLASLHLLASDSASALKHCMDQAAAGDTVVLLGEGVLQATGPGRRDLSMPEGVNWAVLRSDADARGLSRVIHEPGIQPLDDDQLVKLMTVHRHCLTWK